MNILNKASGVLLASIVSVTSAEEPQTVKVTKIGTQASVQGPTENFTGKVRVDTPFKGSGAARVGGAFVTFEPGCTYRLAHASSRSDADCDCWIGLGSAMGRRCAADQSGRHSMDSTQC